MAQQAENLDWTPKQGRILTGGGRAEKLYTPERGFPFGPECLPHHHLLAGTAATTFRAWRAENRIAPQVAGVWNRPVFVGGMEHSSDVTELVYNTQTPSMFIDMRIPRSRPDFSAHSSLETFSDSELRHFSRQHCFSGYSLMSGGTAKVEDPPGEPSGLCQRTWVWCCYKLQRQPP